MSNAVPLLSIIIATRNCADDLHKTLDSLSQASCDMAYEILVQDGNSSDTTLSVTLSYPNLPLNTESSPDTGIYDAWNKALRRASGEWILFMGAGDMLFTKTSLQEAMQELLRLPEDCQYYSVPVVSILPSGEVIENLCPAPSPLTALLHGMCLPHQGLFHRRNLFCRQSFNTAYRIAGDYDFICRTLTATNLCTGSRPYVCMAFGGLSSDMRQMIRREREFLHIARCHFPTRLPWKILLRLLRWYLVNLAACTAGENSARYLADAWRFLLHKPPLWTRRLQQVSLSPITERPHLALCIATIGRVEELDRLAASLKQQTYTDFHVYLADQNPVEILDDVLRRHADLPITRIMLPPRGVSEARNALLPLIGKADIVVFPDDDCWYAPDTLEQIAAAFQRHPEAGSILGIRIDAPSDTLPPSKDVNIGKIGLFKNGETYLQFFRAEAVKGLRFDPQLGPGTGLPYGCGEDTDYLLEAYKRAPVWRCPSIRVFHPSPATHLPSRQKIAAYAAGRMFLLRKHAFPYWFRCANAVYPLLMLPGAVLRRDRKAIWYRWRMFVERMRHF